MAHRSLQRRLKPDRITECCNQRGVHREIRKRSHRRHPVHRPLGQRRPGLSGFPGSMRIDAPATQVSDPIRPRPSTSSAAKSLSGPARSTRPRPAPAGISPSRTSKTRNNPPPSAAASPCSARIRRKTGRHRSACPRAWRSRTPGRSTPRRESPRSKWPPGEIDADRSPDMFMAY